MEDYNTIDITLQMGEQEIDKFSGFILEYLSTQKYSYTPKMYMKAYTFIVRLCDEYDMASDLYRKYLNLFQLFIDKHVLPAIQNKAGDSREFLAEYIIQWKKFTIFTFSMKKLFDYLDRYYLKNGAERS